jgi:hypothetical protein
MNINAVPAINLRANNADKKLGCNPEFRNAFNFLSIISAKANQNKNSTICINCIDDYWSSLKVTNLINIVSNKKGSQI